MSELLSCKLKCPWIHVLKRRRRKAAAGPADWKRRRTSMKWWHAASLVNKTIWMNSQSSAVHHSYWSAHQTESLVRDLVFLGGILEDNNVINEALMNKWSSVRRDYSLHAQEGPDFYFSYSPVIHVSQTHARSLFPPLIQTSTQQRSDTPKSLAYRPAAVFWINFLCALCERE